MVTHSQHMGSEGTAFTAGGNQVQGEGMQLRKRGALSKRIPVVILILFGLALSAAFPYGLGLAVLVWAIALIGALFGVGFASYLLLKELLGKTATFGYAPTTAYMAGKKTKKSRKEESVDEDKKDGR
jgi:hypothetical protein